MQESKIAHARSKISPERRNLIILIGLVLLAFASIYLSFFRSIPLRQRYDTDLPLQGMTPFDCSGIDEITRIDSFATEIDKSEIGPVSMTERSILVRPRIYFAVSSGARTAADHSGSCRRDCRRFQPDAGRCLLSANTVKELFKHTLPNVTLTDAKIGDGTSSDSVGIRCLPSFLIVGTMKAGTGALMTALNRHPMLRSGHGSDGKREIHFFGSANAEQTPPCSWLRYVLHFPNSREVWTFDKSPDILRIPQAHGQMAAMLPSAKLLVLLRNPTTRAVSAFAHNCRHGRYVRIHQPMCLRSYTPHAQAVRSTVNNALRIPVAETRNQTGLGPSQQVEYPANTLIRLDWLIGSASNVYGMDESIKKSFGIAHKYNPFSDHNSGCLYLSACASVTKVSAAAFERAQSCPALSFAALKAHYTALSQPCKAKDVEDYYFGTGSHEWGSHAAEELSHGRYAEQLRSLQTFYPVSQIQLLFQEELLRNNQKMLEEVQAFLGVPKHDLNIGQAHPSLTLAKRFVNALTAVRSTLQRAWQWLCSRGFAFIGRSHVQGQGSPLPTSSPTAQLLSDLTPTCRQDLDNAFRQSNQQLLILLQNAPEVTHYTERELPPDWPV